jgi:hypothetical protein
MIIRHRTLILILLSCLLMLTACGEPHISQDALEATLVEQQSELDAVAEAIEMHKKATGKYPASLGELEIKNIPNVTLPAEYKSLRTASPHYELARDKSFFRLMYTVSDADDYNIYAASSYTSYDKQWQTGWNPERFVWLEIHHYGQLYQSHHTVQYLNLTVQSLMNAAANSTHPCRNFWEEWIAPTLGEGDVRKSYPTVPARGKISIYPAQDTETAYAFVTSEKTFHPMTKPLRIVTAVYQLESKSIGWQLQQTCDSSD